MAEAIMKVEGLNSPDSRQAAVNALHKYSGVLEVDIVPGGGEVRVRYEPYNIYAVDLKETLEREGFRVTEVRQ